MKILDRQVHKLRNKDVTLVKVLWRNQLVKGATWESEADKMANYPHLFPSISIFARGYSSSKALYSDSCPSVILMS